MSWFIDTQGRLSLSSIKMGEEEIRGWQGEWRGRTWEVDGNEAVSIFKINR